MAISVTGVAVADRSGGVAPPEPASHEDRRGQPRAATAGKAAYRPSGRANLPGRVIDATFGNGSLWILGHRDGTGTLDRVATDPVRIVSSLPLASPQAIAFGWGSVWVAQFERDRVLRIDARSGRRLAAVPLVLPRPVSDRPDGRRLLPFDIAAGEKAVWVFTARGSVARIDPRTNRVTDQIPIPPKIGSGVAPGGGAVWVAAGLDGVIRIDPRSRRRTATPIPASSDGDRTLRLSVNGLRQTGRSVYAFGSWAACGRRACVATNRSAMVELASEDGAIKRLMPAPNRSNPVPGGDDGAVWLAPWESRTVSRVLPGGAGIGPRLRLPRPGQAVAATDRSVWVLHPPRRGADQGLVRYRRAG